VRSYPDFLTQIAATADRRGDWPAIEAHDGTFSYAEMDRLSNQLAHRLLDAGLQREARVGVSLPRGATELLSMLAIIKAGAAYVPLDPTHPVERLTNILEDAAPQALIVHPESPLHGARIAGCECIEMVDVGRSVEGWSDRKPSMTYEHEQLAYILFTSGSTGRPKGVEIQRGAFSNFLRSMAHTPGLTEQDRLLAITTTSFDIAGLELFLPLYVGATVVIADRQTTKDPRLLRRKLETSNISMMQATPASWRLLLDAGWQGDKMLRMLCGGEALSPALAERLLKTGAELWNMYGPTETTVWSTIEHIRPDFDRITIGRPIDETQVYVLDPDLKPAAAGVEGELFIGGDGLARGYRGRPELTAEKFIPNPLDRGQSRLYRTGDLGRIRADGRIECLGRLDHQVKISGFRVELGEIETVLRKVPGVAEAVVVAAEEVEGSPYLIAYWMGRAQRELLIQAVRQSLPDYMVPAHYVSVESFPLNTNGKIDRKLLPRPDKSGVPQLEIARPRSDTELRIATIWKEVLGTHDISRDADFFTIGGTSVLATQVALRMEKELGIDVPLQTIFEHPTVEALAANLGAALDKDAPIVMHLHRGIEDRPAVFCLFGVEIYQEFARALDDGSPVIGIHIPFRYLDGVEQPPTVREMAVRYVELIQKYQSHGPYRLLGLCFGGVVAYQVAAELELQGHTVTSVTILDAILPDAIRIDRRQYLIGKVRRVWSGGRGEAKDLIARSVDRLQEKFPGRSSAKGSSPHRQKNEPSDLQVVGPEADYALAQFASQIQTVDAPLLVIRATGTPVVPWMEIAEHQGWGTRAAYVTVRDLKTNHLDIVRGVYAMELARYFREHEAQRSSGKRSSVRSTSSGSIQKSAPLGRPTT
jgi:amino acid adenylation domain-containing protein